MYNAAKTHLELLALLPPFKCCVKAQEPAPSNLNALSTQTQPFKDSQVTPVLTAPGAQFHLVPPAWTSFLSNDR